MSIFPSSLARANGVGMVPTLINPFGDPTAAPETIIEIVAGDGAEVVDASGKRYIDALAGLWYCAVGHRRREIAAAVAAQMSDLEVFHLFDRFSNPAANNLAARLSALAPMDGARVFFTSGGSEAVETAIKLARLAHFRSGQPNRTVVVSRRPSYHGVTLAAMTATGLPLNQEGFGPLAPDMVQVPYDDLVALDALGSEMGERVAVILAEPVVGAGGVWPPPEGYLAALRQRADAWGAFLVLDEVICAFGRLGQWWGAQHYGVVPDMVTFAKGVTSGYLPLGGVLVGEAVRAGLEGADGTVLRHGNTYSGHPVACAAALANLDIIEKDRLLEQAPRIAAVLDGGLAGLVDGDAVVERRGTQGIWALGLGEGVSANAVRDELLDLGVIARPIGTSTLALCPPLVISQSLLERCVEAVGTAVARVAKLR